MSKTKNRVKKPYTFGYNAEAEKVHASNLTGKPKKNQFGQKDEDVRGNR